MCKDCLITSNYPDPIHRDYEMFLKSVQESYDDIVSQEDFVIFKTAASSCTDNKLFDIFLSHIPEEHRQHYNCNSCKHFINKYGWLVSLDSTGKLTSVFWEPSLNQGIFHPMTKELKKVVESAKISGPFFDNKDYLGNNTYDSEYDLRHVFVKRSDNEKMVGCDINKLTGSAIILKRSLREYLLNIDEITIKKALGILQSGKVHRSEKFIANIRWFFDTKTEYCKNYNDNILWYAVMKAPTGFANLGSNLTGWLLEEAAKCKTTLDKESIIRRFNDKVSPMVYQRPTEAPSSGNILTAEKLITDLNLTESLKRRFAKIEEVPLLWRPKGIVNDAKRKGIFSDLVSKEEKQRNDELAVVNVYDGLKAKEVSFLKFLKILNDNEICEIKVERTTHATTYAGVLTAVNVEAPPIIRWDIPTPVLNNDWSLVPYVINENGVETIRNPLSWYVYSHTTMAPEWNLPAYNKYDTVSGITWLPNMFKDGIDTKSDLKGALVFIDGCRDVKKTEPSLGLFPEILIEECRPIRSTLEAYSAAHTPDNRLEATACGIIIQSAVTIPQGFYTFVVTDRLGMNEKYTIVCWD